MSNLLCGAGRKKRNFLEDNISLHLILFSHFCKYSCKNICLHCFWNHAIDESFLSVGFPSYFVLIWFYVIHNTCCFPESSLLMWRILLLHENLGSLEIIGRFIIVFSGTRIIIPFSLQIPHSLHWNLHFISLFHSFICEDSVPSSVSMTGEYFWPFDICLLCKEEIKVEKDSTWSLPAGPDVWIENDVSHYFCFSCYLLHFLAFGCFWYCRSTWLDFTKAGVVKTFCAQSMQHLHLITVNL